MSTGKEENVSCQAGPVSDLSSGSPSSYCFSEGCGGLVRPKAWYKLHVSTDWWEWCHIDWECGFMSTVKERIWVIWQEFNHSIETSTAASEDSWLIMIPLVSLYWSSFIHKHLNAQNESLFSTRNHFRFWICSNLMVKQDFALSWKTQLQSCAWFFCCFLLSLCVSTAAWWENRTAAGEKKQKKQGANCVFGFCDWDLENIQLMKCDQRPDGGDKRWPWMGGTIAAA